MSKKMEYLYTIRPAKSADDDLSFCEVCGELVEQLFMAVEKPKMPVEGSAWRGSKTYGHEHCLQSQRQS